MTDEMLPTGDGTDHPDLSALLRAELSNAEVSAVGQHLDDCEVCRHDLVDFAVGHALLARTARTLRPPAQPAQRTGPASSAAPPLPPPPALPHRGVRRVARPLALAAAAVVLVAGTAGVTARLTRPDPAPPTAAPEQTAILDPVEGIGGGDVLMASHGSTVTMTIETHDLPTTRSGQFYYAWLLDPDTNKMLPLGQVGPSGVATFEVPDSLLLRYAAVDVSLEDDDGDPGHSVTSVLRGSYAAEQRTADS
ncbi:MAG: anti-sigma factor [Nocardioidaceae bacterium]|nr:anti-sigma factor [Nocardioidaceae bacterium]